MGLFGDLWDKLNSVFGKSRDKKFDIRDGNIKVPSEKTYSKNFEGHLFTKVLDHWASQDLPEWENERKVRAPRILLARFWTDTEIDKANRYIQKQRETGIPGSKWPIINPNGDYDFTLMALIPILFLFGEDENVLYPETRKHLLNILLNEKGSGFTTKVPRAFFVEDTENHVLMRMGSKYLTNEWLYQYEHKTHDEYDNRENGIGEGLYNYLKEIDEMGIWEFNSQPYIGYTLSALCNLASFGRGRIKNISTTILDRLNWKYALGSSNFRRVVPFRRQRDRQGKDNLSFDYHNHMMKAWVSRSGKSQKKLNINFGYHHALHALLTPYTPPDKAIDWSLNKPNEYFVKIGHGAKSSPEIHYGNSELHLSAGGVSSGRDTVARPTTLLLNDNAQKIDETFHLKGKGDHFSDWNNTGVYERFAVSSGSIHIPENYSPIATRGNWKIFKVSKNYLLATYNRKGLSILSLHKTNQSRANVILNHLTSNNKESDLNGQFYRFDGPEWKRLVKYDLSNKNEWVIEGTGSNPEFFEWRHVSGQI